MGNTQSASTGYPLVQLYRLDSAQVTFLWADPNKNFSDTAFYGLNPTGYPAGPALAFVYANGIPSLGKMSLLQGPAIFVPLVKK